jgi:hypothetical protein
MAASHENCVFVFAKAAEYLTVNEATSLLSLNSFFKDRLESPSWKRVLVLSMLRSQTDKPVSDDDYSLFAQSEFGVVCKSYEEAYAKLKALTNSILNPYGAMFFKHWRKTPIAQRWGIHSTGTYLGRSRVFVSSCNWCELRQRIELNAITDRFAAFRAYAASEADCRATGQLEAVVWRGNRRVAKYETDVTIIPHDTAVEWDSRWIKMQLNFTVPEGSTSIEIKLRGRDTQKRVEHCGCRFGYAALYLT